MVPTYAEKRGRITPAILLPADIGAIFGAVEILLVVQASQQIIDPLHRRIHRAGVLARAQRVCILAQNGRVQRPLGGPQRVLDQFPVAGLLVRQDERGTWEEPDLDLAHSGYQALQPEPGPQEWELFDLENDPGETTDISDAHPDIIRNVEEIVEKAKNEMEVGIKEAGEQATFDCGIHNVNG